MSLADIRKEREKREVKRCRACGKEIYQLGRAIYVKSRRGSENWYCEECVAKTKKTL